MGEQQHEEPVGRVGLAAVGESAAFAAEVGVTDTGSVEPGAAAEPGATEREETDVAVAAEATRTARETQRPEAGTAAASGGGLISQPAAQPTGMLLRMDGGLVAEEPQTILGSAEPPALEVAESPSPLGATAIAAVVAEEARRQEGPPNEDSASTAAESAGTPAAAGAASTQEHGQVEGDSAGPANGAASDAARAKKKKMLRAQIAPRRPGAGLGPGAPGPLQGWLLQEQSPQGRERQLPSVGQRGGDDEGENGVRPGRPPNSRTGDMATEAANAQVPQRRPRHTVGDNTEHEGWEEHGAEQEAITEAAPTRRTGNATPQVVPRKTRSRTRAQGIFWGRPTATRNGATHTPWLPAGRAPEAGRGGGRNTNTPARGGTTARGRRGGARGAGSARGVIVGGREAPVRTGTWRERHDRPEMEVTPANQEARDSDNPDDGEDFIPSEYPASEDVSLGEEGDTAGGPRRRGDTGTGTLAPAETEGGGSAREGVRESNAVSPAEVAANDAMWQDAATWDVAKLQWGDQPFLVRRMPPTILQSYTLCVLSPLLRLAKNPHCPGAWAILQFLPRLTLRPPPEPVEGSRWARIEERLQQFQQGKWRGLLEEAALSPTVATRYDTKLMTRGSVHGWRV
ncbi:unnamed protein product [Closterium sp. Naga37s-1]|nr:unnamed protein product [Closterium sp. Naga37s-1]